MVGELSNLVPPSGVDLVVFCCAGGRHSIHGLPVLVSASLLLSRDLSPALRTFEKGIYSLEISAMFRHLGSQFSFPHFSVSLSLSLSVSLSLSLCLSVPVSLSPSVSVFVCLCLSLPISLSVSVCLSVCLSLALSLYLSLALCFCVSLFVFLSLSLSFSHLEVTPCC